MAGTGDNASTAAAAAVIVDEAAANAQGLPGTLPVTFTSDPTMDPMQNMMNGILHLQAGRMKMVTTMNEDRATSGGSPTSSGGPHLATAKLEIKNFSRLDKLSQKSEWRYWKVHMVTAIRECDVTFASTLHSYELSRRNR